MILPVNNLTIWVVSCENKEAENNINCSSTNNCDADLGHELHKFHEISQYFLLFFLPLFRTNLLKKISDIHSHPKFH